MIPVLGRLRQEEQDNLGNLLRAQSLGFGPQNHINTRYLDIFVYSQRPGGKRQEDQKFKVMLGITRPCLQEKEEAKLWRQQSD